MPQNRNRIVTTQHSVLYVLIFQNGELRSRFTDLVDDLGHLDAGPVKSPPLMGGAAAVGMAAANGDPAAKAMATRSSMQSKKNELVLNYLDTLEDPLPLDEEDEALGMETERPSKRPPRYSQSAQLHSSGNAVNSRYILFF